MFGEKGCYRQHRQVAPTVHRSFLDEISHHDLKRLVAHNE